MYNESQRHTAADCLLTLRTAYRQISRADLGILPQGISVTASWYSAVVPYLGGSCAVGFLEGCSYCRRLKRWPAPVVIMKLTKTHDSSSHSSATLIYRILMTIAVVGAGSRRLCFGVSLRAITDSARAFLTRVPSPQHHRLCATSNGKVQTLSKEIEFKGASSQCHNTFR